MLESNDHKLTEFALGELEPAEYARVAEFVFESPELQSEVAQIQQLCKELESLLSQEPCPALEAAERELILKAASTMPTTLETFSPKSSKIYSPAAQSRSVWFRRHRKLLYATAALFLMAFTLLVIIPLGARLTQQPMYRASAWLRVEEVHVVYRSSQQGSSDSQNEFPAIEPPEEVKAKEPPLVAPVSQLYSRITSKEVEQELLKARTQALEEQLNYHVVEIDTDEVERVVFAHPSLARLKKDADALYKTKQQILEDADGNKESPQYQAVLKLVKESTQKRVKEIVKLRKEIREEKIAAEMKKREDVLAKAKERIAQNQLEIDLLREKYFEQRDMLKQKSPESMELIYKQRELKHEEAIVELISSRIMRLRTEMNAPAKVTLLRKAERPAEPVHNGWFAFWNRAARSDNQEESPAPSADDARETSYLSSQVQLLRSPLVLEPVLSRPDVAKYKPLAESPEPLKWLMERTHVQARANSELFIVNFTCADPEYAAIIANAIVESYFRIHTQDEVQRSTRVVDLLEDERARRIVVIKQLKEQVKEMSARTKEMNQDAQPTED